MATSLLLLTALMTITKFIFLCFVSTLHIVPAEAKGSLPRANDLVFFQLFTRKNPTVAQILVNGNLDQLLQSNFNRSLPTKIYAHGWVGNPSAQGWGMRDGLLHKEDCNFVAVDWSALAVGDYSLVAAENVPIVGLVTASFVDFLVSQELSLSDVHLIGFSMGAHVVGIAGYNVQSGFLPRITGLDPAGFDFLVFDLPFRLDKSDADFVDIIHTSAETIQDAIGHVDFYPNGGRVQPGCPVREIGCCNHCRAVYLFDESITSSVGFWSVQCNSWQEYLAGLCHDNSSALMGVPVSLTARGTYYLTTNAAPPYAIPPSRINILTNALV